MPDFLDFLFVFGTHQHARETGFSGFRAETIIAFPQLIIESSKRSGQHLQMCYNLKAVDRRTESGQLTATEDFWTIRQAAVNHHLDFKTGASLWLIARAGWDIKERIESLTGPLGMEEDRQCQDPEACFRSSLTVHLLLCFWSSESRRAYLQWLEDSVESQVSIDFIPVRLLLMQISQTYGLVLGPRGKHDPRQDSTSFHLQTAHRRAEETAEAIMVMEGNCSVIQPLSNYYKGLKINDQLPLKDACKSDISSFTGQLDSFVYEWNMQIARASLLAETIALRKAMVA